MIKQMVRLGAVTQMFSGFAFKSENFIGADDDGIKLVRGDNVQQGYIRWGDKTKKWANEEYDALARYQLLENDVILAMDRPVVGGGLKLARIKEQDLPCLLVQRVTCLRGKEDVALTEFIRYVLAGPNFLAHVEKITTGANIPHISGKDIAAFEFDLPPIALQQGIIAGILAYDDLIETNRRRIALLEESARLLYRDWFVDFRFPSRASMGANGLPAGWCYGFVQDGFVLQRGFDLPAANRVTGNTPIYASTGIIAYHNQPKVKGPGIVTGRSGTLGLVQYITGPFWPLNTTLWVKEFKAIPPLIAYFILKDLNLAQFNAGASVPTLDRKIVHSIRIVIPEAKVMADFCQRVCGMFELIETLRQQNTQLAQARDELLPKLMSGELRL